MGKCHAGSTFGRGLSVLSLCNVMVGDRYKSARQTEAACIDAPSLPLPSLILHGRNRAQQRRKPLQKEAALRKFTIHPTNRRMSCLFRQIHQVPCQADHHSLRWLTQIPPLRPNTQRLNHLRRHLLTRKPSHLFVRVWNKITIPDQIPTPESTNVKSVNLLDAELSH